MDLHGDYCMNGITRRKVLELCRRHGIPAFEKNYSLPGSLERR